MKVTIAFQSFRIKNTNTPRTDAAKWMKNIYEKYDKRVISSNFAEDTDSVTAYSIILDEPLIKL